MPMKMTSGHGQGCLLNRSQRWKSESFRKRKNSKNTIKRPVISRKRCGFVSGSVPGFAAGKNNWKGKRQDFLIRSGYFSDLCRTKNHRKQHTDEQSHNRYPVISRRRVPQIWKEKRNRKGGMFSIKKEKRGVCSGRRGSAGAGCKRILRIKTK